MQLKKYTDYGLRVLMYLACQPEQTMTSVRKICDVFSLSANHVNKVVHHLAKLELIDTRRGKNGIVAQGKVLFYQHLSRYTVADLVTDKRAELHAIFVQQIA